MESWFAVLSVSIRPRQRVRAKKGTEVLVRLDKWLCAVEVSRVFSNAFILYEKRGAGVKIIPLVQDLLKILDKGVTFFNYLARYILNVI